MQGPYVVIELMSCVSLRLEMRPQTEFKSLVSIITLSHYLLCSWAEAAQLTGPFLLENDILNICKHLHSFCLIT